MIKAKLIQFICFFILFNQSLLHSQKLSNPLKIPVSLAGNFGELRKNHFHTGLDLKTEQSENYKVYAAEDGYVARIKLSRTGYGKCIYINHPKLNLTTVYAHLNSFETEIQAKINGIQENRKENELDVSFKPGELPVKKGEVIALSGNTGSSGGPHLHFEVRNMTTELAYNPLLFLEKVADSKSPIFSSVLVYEISEEGVSQFVKALDLSKLQNQTINVTSLQVGFGISSYDLSDNAPNKIGIYNYSLKVDNTTQYFFELDSFNFDWQSYILDVSDYHRSESDVYKTYHETCGMNVGNYKSSQMGIINLKPDETTKIAIAVSDFNGNEKKVDFYIKYTPNSIYKDKEKGVINCKEDYIFKSDNFNIKLKSGALASNNIDNFNELPAPKDAVASFQLFDAETAAIGKYFVSYKTAIANKNKLFLQCQLGSKTKEYFGKVTSDGIEFDDVKSFGKFKVILDTKEPEISPNFVKNNGQLIFKVTDSQSGIDNYNLYIDQAWKIAYYDMKTDRIIFDIYPRDRNKTSNVKLIVTDKVGNKKTFQTKIKF